MHGHQTDSIRIFIRCHGDNAAGLTKVPQVDDELVEVARLSERSVFFARDKIERGLQDA